MKTVLFTTMLFLFFFPQSGCSQQIDTQLVVRNLKIRLLTELPFGILSQSALNSYYNTDLKVTTLKSKGFDNFIFFKIGSQVMATDSIRDRGKILSYHMPPCLKRGEECYFVYAFNKINSTFYKLYGTHNNEFSKLYHHLQNEWVYWKPEDKINRRLIKQFVQDYSIEEVDLACLLRSLKGIRGNCLDYFSPPLEVQ